MTSTLIRDLEKTGLKTDLPEIFPGDTVRVLTRIVEGDKELSLIHISEPTRPY